MFEVFDFSLTEAPPLRVLMGFSKEAKTYTNRGPAILASAPAAAVAVSFSLGLVGLKVLLVVRACAYYTV